MLEIFMLIIVGIISFLFIYLRYTYSYWTRRGVVQPPTLPFVGNLLDVVLMRNNPGQIYHKIYCKYYTTHDAVGVYGFMTPKLLLINPELIKQVLISEFSNFHDNEFYVTQRLDPFFYKDPFVLKGEAWKPSRNSLVSAVTPTKVKEMFPYMREQILSLDAFLDNNLGKDIEAKVLAILFAMNNVSNSVFGITSNWFTNPQADFCNMADILMKEQFQRWWQVMILIYLPTLRDLFGYRIIPTKVCDYIENMVRQILEHRKKNNIKRNDVMQTAIDKDKSGDGISEAVSYGAIFFLGGFETSAMVLTFVLYELSMNPEVQQILYEEIKEARADSTDLDYETLINLQYLDRVILETLRKYGIVYTSQKICTKKCSLIIEGKSVEIESNTPIIIPVYSVHHDPRYYPDPDVFDPERFTDFNKGSRPTQTFIPFGDGPRICPGIRFANAQMKLFISNIVYKYKILPSEKSPEKITFTSASFLLYPEHPPFIRFDRRV